MTFITKLTRKIIGANAFYFPVVPHLTFCPVFAWILILTKIDGSLTFFARKGGVADANVIWGPICRWDACPMARTSIRGIAEQFRGFTRFSGISFGALASISVHQINAGPPMSTKIRIAIVDVTVEVQR